MMFVSVRRGLAAAVAAGLLLAAGCANAADAAKGKQTFVRVGCWQCHGYEGQGGVGPKLAPEPMAYETFAAFVRSTSRQMPPYRETVLPDADLADIHAYLQSVPKSPDPKSIPLLGQ